MGVTGRPGASDDVGWLSDPTGRFPERYRTRTGWTRRVRVGAAEAVDEVAPTGSAPHDASPPGGGAPGRGWLAAGEPDSEWRADPTDRFDERWWDGARFTRRVRHGGAVATDTVSPPQDGRRRRRAGSDGSGAGWRPDPDGGGERYHDGHDWTAKRRPAGGQGSGGRPGSLLSWLPRSVAVVLLIVLALAVVLVVAWVL